MCGKAGGLFFAGRTLVDGGVEHDPIQHEAARFGDEPDRFGNEDGRTRRAGRGALLPTMRSWNTLPREIVSEQRALRIWGAAAQRRPPMASALAAGRCVAEKCEGLAKDPFAIGLHVAAVADDDALEIPPQNQVE
jgi:hypothetical protein